MAGRSSGELPRQLAGDGLVARHLLEVEKLVVLMKQLREGTLEGAGEPDRDH